MASIGYIQTLCKNFHFYAPSVMSWKLVSSQQYLRTQARVVVSLLVNELYECFMWRLSGIFHLSISYAVSCQEFNNGSRCCVD